MASCQRKHREGTRLFRHRQNLFLGLTHGKAFFHRVIIPSRQMKPSVSEVKAHFERKRNFPGPTFDPSSFRRHANLTRKILLRIARKSNDVGGSRIIEKTPVEFGHLRIVQEDDRQFTPQGTATS